MKNQWKRLVIAAISSSSVFAGTYYWYHSTENSYSHSNTEKPLAYVGKLTDDIQRRPATRLLWQLVNSGEPLYDGEAIRTSERGEVRIQFTDSERYLDLEPDSLIVIKRSAGEIALDLMEGSLFVNATAPDAAGGPGLVLNSEKGKVDLSKASVALSKGKDNRIDVQVLEGTASIQTQNGQSQDLLNQSRIEILTPTPHKPIAMDVESLGPIPFQWRGFSPSTEVTLWAGPSRKQMKPVAKAEANKSNVAGQLPFGRHFWKLVGTTSDGTTVSESPVYRLEIVPRYAPTVLSPKADAEVATVHLPTQLEFKWQKGDDTRQTSLEVWQDPELKHSILSKSFTSEEQFTLPALSKGTYYWRMSSYYKDSNTPLLGKVQKFTIMTPQELASSRFVPVKVNVTLTPEQLTQFYVDQPALDIKWTADKVDHVASWRVRWKEENHEHDAADFVDVKNTTLSTPVAKPGRYIASIQALNLKGEVLGQTTSSPLTIAPLPILAAPLFSPREGTLLAEKDGRTHLQWTEIPGAKAYWLTIKKDGKELKKSKYSQNSTALKNLLPGEYELEITAIDSHNRSSHAGPTRTLIVPDKSGVKAPTIKKIQVN